MGSKYEVRAEIGATIQNYGFNSLINCLWFMFKNRGHIIFFRINFY